MHPKPVGGTEMGGLQAEACKGTPSYPVDSDKFRGPAGRWSYAVRRICEPGGLQPVVRSGFMGLQGPRTAENTAGRR